MLPARWVRRVSVPGFGRVWDWPIHLLIGGVFVLTLLLSLLFLPLALYTFWVFFSVVAQLGGTVTEGGWLLRTAPTVLAVVVASSGAYLVQEYTVVQLMGRARNTLLRKAGRVLAEPLPGLRFFVGLIHAGQPPARPAEDIGWLVLYPGHLKFVGDTIGVTLPQEFVVRIERHAQPALFGFGGARLALVVIAPGSAGEERLFLVPRADDRSSSTRESARALEQALEAWRTTSSAPL